MLNGKMSGSVTKDFILLNQITELMQNKWRVMLRHSRGGGGCKMGCDSGDIFSNLQHLSIFGCQCQCIRQRGVICPHHFCTDATGMKVMGAAALADPYAMALGSQRSCCISLLSRVAVARIDSE